MGPLLDTTKLYRFDPWVFDLRGRLDERVESEGGKEEEEEVEEERCRWARHG